uniref:Uncharacterized protein n=1 Tax=Aegilops tauschii subsp. strangulata TaxID=200361 RepID=A0A452XDB0_AEGTS
QVLVLHQMDEKMFGEGLTLLGDRLFQLTWLTNVGFTYDRHNFSKVCSCPCSLLDIVTDDALLFLL